MSSLNYPFYLPYQSSTVAGIQNDNYIDQPAAPAAPIGKSQRRSATLIQEFFEAFDPELNVDKYDAEYQLYEKPGIFRNEAAILQERQQKGIDKKQEFSKPKRPRIQKFKKHFTPGQPCAKETTKSIHKFLRNRSRSPSRSPTIPIRSNTNTFLNPPQPKHSNTRSPSLSPSYSPSLSPFDFNNFTSPQENTFLNLPHPQYSRSASFSPSDYSSYASSYENTFLSPPQSHYLSSTSLSPNDFNAYELSHENTFLNAPQHPQYLSSRSPSPSLSPSDFNSSASSSYGTQSCYFSFSPQNQHQSQNHNHLYPPNQWDYGSNTNNQYYPPNNAYYNQ